MMGAPSKLKVLKVVKNVQTFSELFLKKKINGFEDGVFNCTEVRSEALNKRTV
jgi:hypothetical protein